LDVSDHGAKDFSNGFGIAAFSKELHEFILKNKLEKTSVFGYSMGAYVALYLSSQHPEILGNIITLGTKFSWSPEIAEKEIKMLDPEIIKEKVPKFALSLEKRHSDNWIILLNKTAEMILELVNATC